MALEKGLATASFLLLAFLVPLAAAAGSTPSTPPVSSAAPTDCEALLQERGRLVAEQAAIKETIADVALGGKGRRRAPVGAAHVGRAAAGAAASILLPFGIGMAANAAVSVADASARKRRKTAKAAARAEVDVRALIDRRHEIETRLAFMDSIQCEKPEPAQSEGK